MLLFGLAACPTKAGTAVPCRYGLSASVSEKKLLFLAGRGGGAGGGRGVVARVVAGGGVGSGVVAAAGADLVALVVGGLDANAVIFAVERGVGWDVRDRILIAKFVADILERLV